MQRDAPEALPEAAEPPNPNSTATLEKCECALKNAQDLFKNAATREESLSTISRICEEMATCYGPQHPYCAKFHFAYGQALVRQAQAVNEAIPLAEPVPQQPGEGGGEGGEEEEEGGEEGDEKAEEAPSDALQIAWECLEVARVTYEKECSEADNKDKALLLADVYTVLGELQLENEEFEQAYADFTKALEIHTKYASPGSRDVAACHSDLAMASLCLQDKKKGREQALPHYCAAARVLQLHVLEECAKIQALLPKPDAQETDLEGAVKSVVDSLLIFDLKLQEIRDTKELLADLEEKIEELKNPLPDNLDEIVLPEEEGRTTSQAGKPDQDVKIVFSSDAPPPLSRLGSASSSASSSTPSGSSSSSPSSCSSASAPLCFSSTSSSSSAPSSDSSSSCSSSPSNSNGSGAPVTMVSVKRKAKPAETDAKKPKTATE